MPVACVVTVETVALIAITITDYEVGDNGRNPASRLTFGKITIHRGGRLRSLDFIYQVRITWNSKHAAAHLEIGVPRIEVGELVGARCALGAPEC